MLKSLITKYQSLECKRNPLENRMVTLRISFLNWTVAFIHSEKKIWSQEIPIHRKYSDYDRIDKA